jgi:hypothetical protein
MSAGLILPVLAIVFVLAGVILTAVVSTLLWGTARAAWGVARGWRSVNCPRGVMADVRLVAGDVAGCSVYDGGAPVCRRPCLTKLAHAA